MTNEEAKKQIRKLKSLSKPTAEAVDIVIEALENCPPKEARCYGCKDDCRICAMGMG